LINGPYTKLSFLDIYLTFISLQRIHVLEAVRVKICKLQIIEVRSSYLPYYPSVDLVHFVNWVKILGAQNGVRNSNLFVFHKLFNCLLRFIFLLLGRFEVLN
jgi:hypothetical protein